MTMTHKAMPYKYHFGPFAPEIYRLPFPSSFHPIVNIKDFELENSLWLAAGSFIILDRKGNYDTASIGAMIAIELLKDQNTKEPAARKQPKLFRNV